MTDWQKSDWRKKPRVQMPDYTRRGRLEALLRRSLPLSAAGFCR